MTQAIVTISYLVGGLALVHALTRQPSAWVEGDRNKGFWVTMLIIFTVFGLGIVIGPIYGFLVVPRFSGPGAPSEFEKR
jgi:hypothetical protein